MSRLGDGYRVCVLLLAATGTSLLFPVTAQELSATGRKVDEADGAQEEPTKVGGVASARALLQAGRPAEALEVLAQASPDEDPVAVRFLAAQAWIALGRHDRAAALLAAIARERPELLRIRLDLAASLYTLGRYEASERLFRSILALDLKHAPRAVRYNVGLFLERIRAQRRFSIDWELGGWRDDNVNNGAEIDTYELLPGFVFRLNTDARAQSAWVMSTGVRIRYRSQGRGRWYVAANGHARRHWALGKSDFHRTWFGASVGPRVVWVGGVGGLNIGVEQRLLGDDNYYSRPWLGLHVDQVLDRNWSVDGRLNFWETFYDGSLGENTLGRSLQLGLSRKLGPGQLRLTGDLARELADLRHNSWQSRGLRLTYAFVLASSWKWRIEAGYTNTRFDRQNPLFRQTRVDRRRYWQVALSNLRYAWNGMIPMLSVGGGSTDSNVDIYDRTHPVLRVDLVRVY